MTYNSMPQEKTYGDILVPDHSSSDTSEAKRNCPDELFSYWQSRILWSLVFGYAAYYFVRLNITMALPEAGAKYGYSKMAMGTVFTVWSMVYGVGKFFNGYLSDRSNSRWFMTIGLLGAAVCSYLMAFGDNILFFSIVWGIGAWFQSMGWPPVTKSLTHWYPPTQLGTKWGIANLSHQVGGAITHFVAGYIILWWGWETAFTLPAVVAFIMAIVLYERLRDTPHSLGLPSIEKKMGLNTGETEEEEIPLKELLRRVFCNRNLWLICLGNMFLYIVRMGIINWAPSFLREAKNVTLTASGLQVATYEIGGMLGGLAAGWLSDVVFKGRRGPISCLNMICLIGCLIYFWHIPAGFPLLNMMIMFSVGVFVYGSQVLVGVAAADFASKKAVGMAVGLTGTFGYLGGSALSGTGIGWVVDKYGWDGGFVVFIISAILGALCFAFTWNKSAKTLEKQ